MIDILLRVFGIIVGLFLLLISGLELALGFSRLETFETVNMLIMLGLGGVFMGYGMLGRERVRRLFVRMVGKSRDADGGNE